MANYAAREKKDISVLSFLATIALLVVFSLPVLVFGGGWFVAVNGWPGLSTGVWIMTIFTYVIVWVVSLVFRIIQEDEDNAPEVLTGW
jgi:uncharacterized membrane protein